MDYDGVAPGCVAALLTLTLAGPTHAGTDPVDQRPAGSALRQPEDRSRQRARRPRQGSRRTFIYTRAGWPVEITAEFENWRRIRDYDGSEGWVYHSLLSGKRTASVQLKSKTDLAPLHAKPDAKAR